MYCKKCGKEIDDNSRYCKHCGADQTTKWVIEINKPNMLFAKDKLRKYLCGFLFSISKLFKAIWSIAWKCAVVLVIGLVVYLAVKEYYIHKFSAPEQVVYVSDLPKECVERDTVFFPVDYEPHTTGGIIFYAKHRNDINHGKADVIEINGIKYNRLIYWRILSLPQHLQYCSGKFDDDITDPEPTIKDAVDLGARRNRRISDIAHSQAGEIIVIVYWVGYIILLLYYIRKVCIKIRRK